MKFPPLNYISDSEIVLIFIGFIFELKCRRAALKMYHSTIKLKEHPSGLEADEPLVFQGVAS